MRPFTTRPKSGADVGFITIGINLSVGGVALAAGIVLVLVGLRPRFA
jgi:hypothetical protein